MHRTVNYFSTCDLALIEHMSTAYIDMETLPLELIIKIAFEGRGEYTFNYLIRALPALGRYTIGHRGENMTSNNDALPDITAIIDRRLDLMIEFGYDVLISADDIRWMKNGLLHRNDGPAVQCIRGMKAYYHNGEMHRSYGPAKILSDGTKMWYIHGNLHRVGGPAVVWNDGNCKWYCYGHLHRDGGPAIINADGSHEWYHHGRKHRTNGPAITRTYGRREYWINGRQTLVQQSGCSVMHGTYISRDRRPY